MITRYRFNNNSVHQDAAMSWLLCGQNMGWLEPDPEDNPSTNSGQGENYNGEELFHFIHPEVEYEEALRIHVAIKRLVAYQKAKEICEYLHDLKKRGKVMLPSNVTIMYNELIRMGMPSGDGYTEKNFRNYY